MVRSSRWGLRPSFLGVLVAPASAQDLKIYGPGGPEPAIREAAAQFGAAHRLPSAREFSAFLASPAGAQILRKFGWIAPGG